MLSQYFLITIDTECDNNWRPMASLNSVKNRISLENGKYLPRFQSLCEKYGFVPTYLVDWEMTFSTALVDMVNEGLPKGRLDVGMHMHAWSCPPYYHFSQEKCVENGNPYITEYPTEIIEQKVRNITERLKNVFGLNSLISHRSGRWCVDAEYLRILLNYGYKADCSVTPYVNWHDTCGMTAGSCGPDYSDSTPEAYIFSPDDFFRPVSFRKGQDTDAMLEVPVTIQKQEDGVSWLRPNGSNLSSMKVIVDGARDAESEYLMFMIHSSELMPFGSPNFRTEFEIEKLYQQMDILFAYMKNRDFRGIGLSDFTRGKLGIG